MSNITDLLLENADESYKLFSKKLVPDTSYPMLGIRIPTLKKIAKSIVRDDFAIKFLKETHHFYEEFLLHGLILGKIDKNLDEKLILIEEFLPFIDNWAICDCTVAGLKFFNKYPNIIFDKTVRWINSAKPYTVRFGIVTLLSYFLDDNFSINCLEVCSKIKSDNYYVNMALAWFYSVALVKQYDLTIPYLTEYRLSKFVHNKTIQKAIESFRLSNDKKEFLRNIKI